MSNESHATFPYAFSNDGQERIIRAHKMSSCFAELLTLADISPSSRISVEGMAAVFECLAEQLDGAIGSSELFQGEAKVGGHDAD